MDHRNCMVRFPVIHVIANYHHQMHLPSMDGADAIVDGMGSPSLASMFTYFY